jgi:thioredoxin 1
LPSFIAALSLPSAVQSLDSFLCVLLSASFFKHLYAMSYLQSHKHRGFFEDNDSEICDQMCQQFDAYNSEASSVDAASSASSYTKHVAVLLGLVLLLLILGLVLYVYWYGSGSDTTVSSAAATSGAEGSHPVSNVTAVLKHGVQPQTATTVLLIWSPSCVYCKRLLPIYQEVSKKFANDALFFSARFDKMQKLTPPAVLQQLNITALPIILLFKNGQMLPPLLGNMSQEALEARLQSVLSAPLY